MSPLRLTGKSIMNAFGMYSWMLIGLCLSAAVGPDPFRVGTIEGITPGKSFKRDVIRTWGRADDEFVVEDGVDGLWFKPKKGREWALEVWYPRKTGRVFTVIIHFDRTKEKAEVERLFGLKFQLKHYNWVKCGPGKISRNVREVSEYGELQYYEDRSRGAVVLPDGLGIRSVEFHDVPLGAGPIRCTPEFEHP
jgi:hypothetical protein